MAKWILILLLLLLLLQLVIFASPPISNPWRRNSDTIISTSTTTSRIISPPDDDPDDPDDICDPDDDICTVLSSLDVKDLMDLTKHLVKKPALKSLKADIPIGSFFPASYLCTLPRVIVHELRLTMDEQVLRIHGIWIGTLKDGDVEHLKNQHKATQNQRRIVGKQEQEAFEDSYKKHLEKFWYHAKWRLVSSFCVYEAFSHGSYSRSVHMTDYIRTTATYGLRFVEGGDHDLMKILAELGHKFGDLINGRELVQDLKKLLGVDGFSYF